MGIFLVKTVRLYKPDRLGYFAVVLVYMGPYSFYLHCVYSETLFMMLIAVFFYYLKKKRAILIITGFQQLRLCLQAVQE